MISKAAISSVERAWSLQWRLEIKNGADAERVSSRANQTTRGVANVNNS
jgi:hypothetical protein